MKASISLLAVLLVALLLFGCSLFSFSRDFQMVKPSDVVITEERTVSGFTGIDMSTFGRVIITQGDSEKLTIKGSDNIVPLVSTTVNDGVLVIRTKGDVNITGTNSENVLTLYITVKDLTKLADSGVGEFEMDALSTTGLDVNMSGAGQVTLGKLAAESLNIDISGVGGVEMAGEVNQARIEISGAGNVKAPDLKIKTADVNISGIGGAELWVTDQLTGEISSAGSVSYYGDPQVDTNTSGIGSFKSLGDK